MTNSFEQFSQSLQKASEAFQTFRKHFGDGDVRQWSDTHVGTESAQKPHGNRPGQRTQEGVLATLELTPPDWSSRSPKEQTDYFVRATGYSTPVIELSGEGHYLAPPGVKMLPERGAGENVESDDSGYVGEMEANTQLDQGIEEEDKLTLPEGEEEQKRYLEAAAEHRENDYQGPTTPRFEEMWGDKLRSEHPARKPRSTGGLSGADQQKLLQETVKQTKSGRLRRLGRHFDEAALVSNLLQYLPETLQSAEPVRTAVQAVLGASVAAPGRRSTASEEASQTAEQNAERQEERAEERREATSSSAEERRRRIAAARTRGRRVEDRLR